MSVLVDIALASICFLGQCHNVLVGPTTPQGIFPLESVQVTAKGYGGNALLFKETPKDAFAIHRVWLGRPSERRAERLKSTVIEERQTITNGCINADPAVFDQLRACVLRGECPTVEIINSNEVKVGSGSL